MAQLEGFFSPFSLLFFSSSHRQNFPRRRLPAVSAANNSVVSLPAVRSPRGCEALPPHPCKEFKSFETLHPSLLYCFPRMLIPLSCQQSYEWSRPFFSRLLHPPPPLVTLLPEDFVMSDFEERSFFGLPPPFPEQARQRPRPYPSPLRVPLPPPLNSAHPPSGATPYWPLKSLRKILSAPLKSFSNKEPCALVHFLSLLCLR